MRHALVLTVFALCLTTAGPAEAEPVTLSDVRIEMSDGIELAGDVRLPDGAGAFPAILVMSPYGREDNQTLTRDYLPLGYAHVNVDVRGSGGSGGTLCLFCLREQRDVYEVVEWIAAQPWSDGNVGQMGGSYLAITALMGAAQQPPHLRAVVAEVPFTDMYRDIIWHNGIWNQFFMNQWPVLQTALGANGIEGSSRPLDRTGTVLATSFRNEPLDGPPYWERSVYTRFDRIRVPVMFISGWFDGFSRGTIRNFQGVASEQKKLYMYPRAHAPITDPLNPYGAAPPPDFDDPQLAWFDRFLRGAANGVDDGPSARYFDLGTASWESSSAWPPTDASLRSFFLAGGGVLSDDPPSGTATLPDGYLYDPTIGATETTGKWTNVAAGPHARVDQRPDQMRQLAYTTDVLDEPLALAGPIELRFWGQTDAEDTDWIVKVSDVAPDGTALLITSGYLRASHREVDESRSLPAEPWISNTRELPVYGDVPIEYRMDVWPVAATIQPGHRLAIQIASSDVPNHEPLPYPARNQILHDDAHPSVLTVTVR